MNTRGSSIVDADAHIMEGPDAWGYRPKKTAGEYLRSGKIFLTFESEDRLADVVEVVGEDQLMLSSDIPHFEGEEDAFGGFKKRTDVSDRLRAKILGANAVRFYGLPGPSTGG